MTIEGTMRSVRLPVLIALVATRAFAEGQVLLFPAVGTPAQLTVAGRVFKEPRGAGTGAVSRNLRALLASKWEEAPLQVRYAGQVASTLSGHDGNFEVTFTAPKDQPFKVGLSKAEAACKGAGAGSADVDIISPDAPFFVISDFDDTLAVTQVTKKRDMVKHALAEEGDTQPLVEGMPQLMRCLREGKKERPVFALVSGSPVQFVPRTQRFLFKNDFPPFGLYLRDLGPGTLSDYKQPMIRMLLKAVPQPVVLVGDSGEHDPEVYAQMRSEFPDRVKLVAIHDVGRLESKDRVKDMLVFKHPRELAPQLVELGLITQGCADAAFK
jgi:phosphatidate phosphatase APP1